MKEKEIKTYMEKLGISKEEAEQLWKDDHENFESPEMKEMELKARKINRREKSSAPRKKGVYKRKEDLKKREIISTIAENLSRVCLDDGTDYHLVQDIIVKKPEKEITFRFMDENYSVTLTRHRAPK